jgi:hypothetical protein
MVEQLVTMSQVRQKVIARRFAEFLADLYLEVYNLLLENGDQALSMQIAGDWVQVQPSLMGERERMSIDFALGYGEKQREAEKYIKIDQYLAADPRLGPYYTPDRRFTVLSRALEGQNIKDVPAIIADPKTVPPPQPDPHAQAELAKLQAETALIQAQAQAEIQKLQLELQKLTAQAQLEQAKLALQTMKVKADIALKTETLEHKEVVDAAELRMAAETQAAGQMTGEALVST